MNIDIEAERKLFENNMLPKNADLSKTENGAYTQWVIQVAWLTWCDRAALAAPQQEAPFTEHDLSIIKDIEVMAADKNNGFWSQALANAALRLINRKPAPPAAPTPIARDTKIQAHPTPEGYPVEGVFGASAAPRLITQENIDPTIPGPVIFVPDTSVLSDEHGIEWAMSRWIDEVSLRPLVNKHRRTLDDTWRQVIRHFGGDPEALIGPSHDDLINGAGRVLNAEDHP